MNDDSMSNKSEEPLAPIDITGKLDLLENPARPPIVIYKHTDSWDQFKKGLDPIDQQIVNRLQKLKDKQNIPLPSVEEIKQRLALLKGQDTESGESDNVDEENVKTDHQKTDDLIQEYLAQLELSCSDPCTEIQQK